MEFCVIIRTCDMWYGINVSCYIVRWSTNYFCHDQLLAVARRIPEGFWCVYFLCHGRMKPSSHGRFDAFTGNFLVLTFNYFLDFRGSKVNIFAGKKRQKTGRKPPLFPCEISMVSMFLKSKEPLYSRSSGGKTAAKIIDSTSPTCRGNQQNLTGLPAW